MHFQFMTFLQSMIGQLTFSTPGSAGSDFYSRVAVIQYTDSEQTVSKSALSDRLGFGEMRVSGLK